MDRNRGSVGVLLIALVLGGAIGFFVGWSWRGRAADPPLQRPMQGVIDQLISVPASPVGTVIWQRQGNQIAQKSSLSWDTDLVIDVGNISAEKFHELLTFYFNYLSSALRKAGINVGDGSGAQSAGIIRMGDGTFSFGGYGGSPDTFEWSLFAENAGGTRAELVARLCDFDSAHPGGMSWALPMKNPGDPVRGQRVAWLTLIVRARGFSDIGTFPERRVIHTQPTTGTK